MSTGGVGALREPDAAVRRPYYFPWGVQQLSWRCLAVGENFSNRRRKFINARTGHDDAIAAAMSFLSDTQELASVIFPELDIEVLALNLQFSRLDDVIHFASRAPSLGGGRLKWKKNRRPFKGIS
jgi:hypothetical protein